MDREEKLVQKHERAKQMLNMIRSEADTSYGAERERLNKLATEWEEKTAQTEWELLGLLNVGVDNVYKGDFIDAILDEENDDDVILETSGGKIACEKVFVTRYRGDAYVILRTPDDRIAVLFVDEDERDLFSDDDEEAVMAVIRKYEKETGKRL